MRVFVGTMLSGEADFERCLAAVQGQVHPDVTHFIVAGRPEAEAHRELYEEWNRVKGDHGLFLKVDADTVLCSDRIVSDLVGLFSGMPRLTGTQSWLDDRMTDGRIFGMACIRNTVTVKTDVDPLYCDRVDSGHDVVLRGDALPPSLRVAGDHCRYADDRQAFHFGLHRMLKNQRDVLGRVFAAWHRDGDRVRAFALVGGQMARRFTSNRRFNYGDPEFKEALAEATARHEEFVGHLRSLEMEKIG